VAATFAAPVGFQVFRMTYYAMLVPNTALAKEAGRANWAQGVRYLSNFVGPYWLWIPLSVLAVLVALRVSGDLQAGQPLRALAVVAPVAAGAVDAVYVVGVGGDFMHARMLLPAMFAICRPVPSFRVPRGSTVTMALAVALAGWALVCGIRLRPQDVTRFRFGDKTLTAYATSDGRIDDERRSAVHFTGHHNPITVHDWAKLGDDGLRLRQMAGSDHRGLFVTDAFLTKEYPLRHDLATPVVATSPAAGVAAYAAGPDVTMVDPLGLGDPIGSHLELRRRGRPGHEKLLDRAWIIARYAPPDFQSQDASLRTAVDDARHAVRCGALRRLLRDVTTPLGPASILTNLTDSFSNTAVRLPWEPGNARAQLCGP